MAYITYRDEIYKVTRHKLSLKNKEINDIYEIKGLENLTDLRYLHLSKNNIKEIKNLENLKELVALDLSNNKIEEIKNLEHLEKLQYLWLSNNNINEIKGLDSLTDLRSLSLNGNQIEEVKGLDNLMRLNVLYLDNNKISDVKGIESLWRLGHLDLGKKSGLTKEQLKSLKKRGVLHKKQVSFGNFRNNILKFLLYIIVYLIAVVFLDFMITIAIISNFNLPSSDFGGIFGVLFVPLLVIAPIIYMIAASYV